MMTRLQALLGKVSEECHETGQRALKAQKFGLFQTQPGHTDDNAKRLRDELNDLKVAIMLIEELTGADLHTMTFEEEADRRQRVEKYMVLAANLGMVDLHS